MLRIIGNLLIVLNFLEIVALNTKKSNILVQNVNMELHVNIQVLNLLLNNYDNDLESLE